MVSTPESEIGADRSHTPCLPWRLLSCVLLCLHLLQAVYCKIMQYICKNIHSPTRLKTLPCQWAAIACLLQMDSASYCSCPVWFFCSSSFCSYLLLLRAFTIVVQVILTASTLPTALNSYFVPQWTQSKFLQEEEGKNCISDCFWGKYNQRGKRVIECIIMATTELGEVRPCWY